MIVNHFNMQHHHDHYLEYLCKHIGLWFHWKSFSSFVPDSFCSPDRPQRPPSILLKILSLWFHKIALFALAIVLWFCKVAFVYSSLWSHKATLVYTDTLSYVTFHCCFLLRWACKRQGWTFEIAIDFWAKVVKACSNDMGGHRARDNIAGMNFYSLGNCCCVCVPNDRDMGRVGGVLQAKRGEYAAYGGISRLGWAHVQTIIIILCALVKSLLFFSYFLTLGEATVCICLAWENHPWCLFNPAA